MFPASPVQTLQDIYSLSQAVAPTSSNATAGASPAVALAEGISPNMKSELPYQSV